ncbi:MAG: GNAT family protein [Bacilli bacterium]|nr:GNAT family protein [Bacilli bacterium]
MRLDSFVLEKYDLKNAIHVRMKDDLILSPDSFLISRDIDNFIRKNIALGDSDGITATYVINWQEEFIGLCFVNYHPREIRNEVILEEEIEIGLGLLPQFRGKHLGSTLERELSSKLLSIYPQFSVIVARIDAENIRSINSALKAGFEHLEDDVYQYKR